MTKEETERVDFLSKKLQTEELTLDEKKEISIEMLKIHKLDNMANVIKESIGRKSKLEVELEKIEAELEGLESEQKKLKEELKRRTDGK